MTGLQVEPEDVTVWQLWSVVPRGLHAVSNQAFAVWGQVHYRVSLQKADSILIIMLKFCAANTLQYNAFVYVHFLKLSRESYNLFVRFCWTFEADVDT